MPLSFLKLRSKYDDQPYMKNTYKNEYASAPCDVGAFSYLKQKKLWGDPSENVKDTGMVILHELSSSDFGFGGEHPWHEFTENVYKQARL
jgi:hypothetical protein